MNVNMLEINLQSLLVSNSKRWNIKKDISKH